MNTEKEMFKLAIVIMLSGPAMAMIVVTLTSGDVIGAFCFVVGFIVLVVVAGDEIRQLVRGY